MGKVNVRDLALQALLAMAKEENYSHAVIGQMLEKYDYLEVSEKAFLKRLTEGTLERRIELDYCIDQYSKVPVHKMKPLIRELMRMSAYQLLYMDSVPDSAVCNEAVKLADAHSFHALKGFVNGVLRSLSRQKKSVSYPVKEKDRIGYLSVKYSMPVWLIQKWDTELGYESFGQDKTEELLGALLKERPVTIRLKRSLDERQRDFIKKELETEGVRVKTDEKASYIWYLERTEGLKSLEAFCRGMFTVQDKSSVLALEAAGIQAGDFVMDVCAAPGGKALYASELAGEKGSVLARDVSGYKCSLIREAVQRMGAENVVVEEWDACNFDREKKESADVVLADVPCSGLGVIGKKQDIKYRVSPDGMEALVSLQRKILETASGYVKPGGKLLYSTCTISRSENQENAEWFASHFSFLLEESRQFLPSEDGTDGFYYARFVRKSW